MATNRPESIEEFTPAQAVEAGAKDGLFFCYYYLPSSFPLAPGPHHHVFWQDLNDMSKQFLCFEAFRDSAKTTTARAAALRSICYALSRTIVIISESSSIASDTLDWIRDKIRNNQKIREHFSLTIGDRDNSTELRLLHGLAGQTINLVSIGIHSQLRGLNILDMRPDLILVDDAQTLENSGTPETIKAITDRFFGSVVPSLAARSVSPHARIIYLGTRSGEGDIIEKVNQDPEWSCRRFSIFNEAGESAWPAKWSTEEVQKKKEGFIGRNQYSIWMREYECKLVKAEKTAMAQGWYSPYIILPQNRTMFAGLDPVPPPSERQLQKGLADKDYEALSIMALSQGKVYVEDVILNKGHEIDWTIEQVFRAHERWRLRCIGAEAVAYQRTVAAMLEREARKRRVLLTIVPVDDKRGKFHRITNEIGPLAEAKSFLIKEGLDVLREQFLTYPGVTHDDALDACAIGITAARKVLGYLFSYTGDDPLDADFDPYTGERNPPPLPPRNFCP